MYRCMLEIDVRNLSFYSVVGPESLSPAKQSKSLYIVCTLWGFQSCASSGFDFGWSKFGRGRSRRAYQQLWLRPLQHSQPPDFIPQLWRIGSTCASNWQNASVLRAFNLEPSLLGAERVDRVVRVHISNAHCECTFESRRSSRKVNSIEISRGSLSLSLVHHSHHDISTSLQFFSPQHATAQHTRFLIVSSFTFPRATDESFPQPRLSRIATIFDSSILLSWHGSDNRYSRSQNECGRALCRWIVHFIKVWLEIVPRTGRSRMQCSVR
ncbi:uncharacterized protein BDW70DRAFT_30455 [Aspergillus foveolatus]|uniref:uncharacterized protein n=1 Tax=Aspergillus foveolatus TaxID=210207 RepID=UPI003CCDCB7E